VPVAAARVSAGHGVHRRALASGRGEEKLVIRPNCFVATHYRVNPLSQTLDARGATAARVSAGHGVHRRALASSRGEENLGLGLYKILFYF